MQQQSLPGLASGGRLRPAMIAGGGLYWIRTQGRPQYEYTLCDQAGPLPVVVRHCGHPTALWPYYIEAHGRMVVAPNGRGFRHVVDARQAAVLLHHKETNP